MEHCTDKQISIELNTLLTCKLSSLSLAKMIAQATRINC